MLYQAYQAHSELMWPLRAMARISTPMLLDPRSSLSRVPALRRAAAACKVMALAELTQERPAWRIKPVLVDGQAVPVLEEVVFSTPFASLLRFAKPGAPSQPKVLVVAPMSGHFATLLRDTVQTVLQDHDVYVTDWHNVQPDAGHYGVFSGKRWQRHIYPLVRDVIHASQ